MTAPSFIHRSASSTFSAWFERQRRELSASGDATTTLVLALLIAGGIVLRIQGLGSPANFTFDEELFVRNAHRYLVGIPDANDHPPLGKLFMAIGLLLFGYNSVGWRFASLCFGIQSIFVAYWLTKALFNDRRSALFAAAFIAGDGFFIAYSRAGLLDGMLTCLVLWSLLAAVTARSFAGVLGTAVLVGLAMSVKWSGALVVIPAAAAVWFLGRAPKASVLGFAAVPIVHVAIWSFGLSLTGEAYDLRSLWNVMVKLFRHHLELGHRQNPLASRWYSWIVLYHPIVVKLSHHGVKNQYASSVGNPLLWFSASLAAIGVPVLAAGGAVVRRAKKLRDALLPAPRISALVLALGWFALFSPWIVARGTFTFMYHYMPSYALALVLLAGCAAKLERKWPVAVSTYALFVLLIATFFAPVWAELPLSEGAANVRLPFRSWQP